VRCYRDDHDLIRRINVEEAVPVTCQNAAPKDRRDWRAALRVRSNVAHRRCYCIDELLGGLERMTEEVTEMLMKLLFSLFDKALRLQLPLTRE